MVKLFVTDLDGTLLQAGAAVSAKNSAAVRRMTEAGITVSIATGRMYSAALPIARALGVDVPIVTYNGALVRRASGAEIFSATLEPALVTAVVDYAHERGWALQTYSDDHLYYPEETETTRRYEAHIGVRGTAIGWEGLRHRTHAVHKLLSITSGRAETDARIAAVNDHFAPRLSAISSCATFVEINATGITKATGLEHLARALGVTRSETMATGDSDNDLPLLTAAGRSIAMGNATDEVKRVADYLTTDVADDGFAAAVERYVLSEA